MTSLFDSLLLVCWLTLHRGDGLEPVLHDPARRINITVYQQMEDRGHMLVICTCEWNMHLRYCELSVQSEHHYSLKKTDLSTDNERVFKVVVTPPAYFTCMCATRRSGKLHSEVYDYTEARKVDLQDNNVAVVLDHRGDHEEGVFSFYIGFVSFVAVGLIIMTAAVIVTNFKSNTKEPTVTATNNDYEDES